MSSQWVDLPPKPVYTADGTGRDTYIHRDHVASCGKQSYKATARSVTRFGTAGCTIPRDKHTGFAGHVPGEHEAVGGNDAGHPADSHSRSSRLDRATLAAAFPVGPYTTMKELTQDRMLLSSSNRPEHLGHIAGYAGHQPRGPVSDGADTIWTRTSSLEQVPPEHE